MRQTEILTCGQEDGELVNARLILQPTPSNDPNDPLVYKPTASKS